MTNDYSVLELIARLANGPIASEKINKARENLLDYIGCVFGARNKDQYHIFNSSGLGFADLICLTGNLLEMDDVHRAALLHPGPIIWPTIIIANKEIDDLDQLLRCGIIAYRAMCALGVMLDGKHYAKWHPTSTCGVFGAAIAASSALGLSLDQSIHAASLALSVSGGFWNFKNSVNNSKQWHLRNAIMTGLDAARLSKLGFRGARDVIEGPQGMFEGFCDQARNLPEIEAIDLNTISFKPWASCRHTHPAIDAANELKGISNIEGKLCLSIYSDAIKFCDNPSPKTPIEAKFSLQYCIGLIRAGRNCGPEDFTIESIKKYIEFAREIEIKEDKKFTSNYPNKFSCSLENGFKKILLLDTKGDPERPLSREELITKYDSMAKWGGIDQAISDEIKSVVLNGNSANIIVSKLSEALCQ